MGQRWKKVILAFTVLIATVALGTGLASAQNPHFIAKNTDVTVDSSGLGDCTFKVAGYGNLPTGSEVTVTCSASANACYACKNNGGNFPTAPNKKAQTGTVSATGEFPVASNGSVTGSLAFSPPPSTLTCPGGQHTVLVSVTYTDVELTSEGAAATFPGTFSRTLETNPAAQCPTP